VAEVHLIAVDGEDFPLGVALFDLDRENRFLDLALQRLLVGEPELFLEVARELLREVLAPWARRRSMMSVNAATAMRQTLTPKWRSNSVSSVARMACRSSGLMSS
jgi:hypothetical protein